jgi:hypothetical protein
MATTNNDSVIVADLFTDAVQGEFKDQKCFVDSGLSQMGAVIIRGDMPDSGRASIGRTVTVPYFANIGEFEDIATDGSALTPAALSMSSEQATVAHAALGFEMTTWAQAAAYGGDLYAEGAKQIGQSAKRKMDRAIIDAAVAAGGITIANAVTQKLEYDLVVDAMKEWQDSSNDDLAGIAVHSRVFASLLKLKDGVGRPLLTPSPVTGKLSMFLDLPIVKSDRLPLTNTLSAVTSSGTSPPVVTLTGTPNRYINFKMVCTVLGARGTSFIKYSINGGNTYSTAEVTAATILMLDPLTGESTGVTINIAAGAAAVDNVWTATSSVLYTSLLLKKGALAFWYNANALQLKTDVNIDKDVDKAAMHLYYAAYRYKRVAGSQRPGVITLTHGAD